MIVDDPTLTNGERLKLVAEALELTGQPVHVWVFPTFDKRRIYRNWLTRILYERGHSDEAAAILAGGAIIHFEV